jgi:hypothetical protein
MSRKKYIKNINIFKVVASKWILGILMFSLFLAAHSALGIGAASFFCGGEDGAEKDIAESPTASPERPKKDNKTTRPQDNKLLE